MDPLTALAAFAPLAVDLGKSLIARYVSADGFKPANIDDWSRMREADTALFTAVNAAGSGQASYPWVEAIVRLQRPLVAACALGTWTYCNLTNSTSPEVENFASCVGFYLFGDRTLFYVRRSPK